MSNSFSYSENPIHISRGNIYTRMQSSPLEPGELFLNYQKNIVKPASGKKVSNPYELWIGTLNPKQPIRLGAGGFLTLAGNFSEFFEVSNFTDSTNKYTKRAVLPSESTYSSLKIGNIYYIDDNLYIEKTDRNPGFQGGDLAVYFGDGRWWNTSNSQYIDEIEYHPPKRANINANADYDRTKINNAKDALDELYVSKADLDKYGKIYYSELPDDIRYLANGKFSPQYGPFEVRKNISGKDTFAVNPTDRDRIDNLHKTKAHNVDIYGDLNIKNFSTINAFGPDQIKGKQQVAFGVNGKIFGFPYNTEIAGFKSQEKDLGNLNISGNSNINGSINVNKSLTVKENTELYGETTIGDSLYVKDNIFSHGYLQKYYTQIDLSKYNKLKFYFIEFDIPLSATANIEIYTKNTKKEYARLYFTVSSNNHMVDPTIIVIDNTQTSLTFNTIKVENDKVYVSIKAGQIYNIALNTKFAITNNIDIECFNLKYLNGKTEVIYEKSLPELPEHYKWIYNNENSFYEETEANYFNLKYIESDDIQKYYGEELPELPQHFVWTYNNDDNTYYETEKKLYRVRWLDNTSIESIVNEKNSEDIEEYEELPKLWDHHYFEYDENENVYLERQDPNVKVVSLLGGVSTHFDVNYEPEQLKNGTYYRHEGNVYWQTLKTIKIKVNYKLNRTMDIFKDSDIIEQDYNELSRGASAYPLPIPKSIDGRSLIEFIIDGKIFEIPKKLQPFYEVTPENLLMFLKQDLTSELFDYWDAMPLEKEINAIYYN